VKRLAVALGILGALVAAPAAADPGTDLSVSGVTIDHGHVHFTVTADHLPPGVSLDSASLSVDLDGVALPATVTRTAAPPPKPREVVLIVDTSGSMAGARLAGAKAAADGYADGLPADVALGLVSVADAPVTVLAPLVDGALMVVRAGVTPKPAIENALRAFDSSRLLGVVLNDIDFEGKDSYYYSYYYYQNRYYSSHYSPKPGKPARQKPEDELKKAG